MPDLQIYLVYLISITHYDDTRYGKLYLNLAVPWLAMGSED